MLWRKLSLPWCPAENEQPDIAMVLRNRVAELLGGAV
jgi:hypothetical protein